MPDRWADAREQAQDAYATTHAARRADPTRVAASLARRGLDAHAADAWPTKPGIFVVLLDIHEGLRAPGLLILPIGPLLRARPTHAALHDADAPRLGDLVVHDDHGIARLHALRVVDGEKRLAMRFADEAELLVPAWDLGRIWRLGGDGHAPDHIGGEAWRRRRAEVEAEVQATATQLAQAAAARAAVTAPAIEHRSGAAALHRRFPHPLTPCQRAAIDAVQADLAAGRPMDRLVCGDVGFGKTEVALRAAASAALAGWQVLVAAPTTVLARQHLEVFERRFAGTGIAVAGLIRGATTPEGGHRPHLLTMTATPIPRTLQGALVGLRDVSLLRTRPARRQPTRTFALPWDSVVVREALLRERRRGGRSFLAVPPHRRPHCDAIRVGGACAGTARRRRPWPHEGRCVGGCGCRLRPRRGRRAAGDQHHRGRAGHPARQPDDRLGRGPLRPGAAARVRGGVSRPLRPPGPALDALLLQARLRLLLRAAGVASADLGSEAAALTPVDPTNPAAFAALAARVGGTVHGARVVLPWHERDPAAQAGRLLEMLG